MRRITLSFLLALLLAATAFAHPMGNLSVNHYARLEPTPKGVLVTYVLDMAEIPTFEMMQSWGIKQDAPQQVLQTKAKQQSAEWVKNLTFREDGKPVAGRVESTQLSVIDGAGNLPVFRIETKLLVAAKGGKFEFEDGNYPTRAGWREIVVAAGKGVTVKNSTHSDRDVSKGLTAYPQDPTVAPPQDRAASFEWESNAAPVLTQGVKPTVAKPVPATAPVTTAAAPPVASQPVAGPPVGGPPVGGPSGVRPPEQPAAGTIQRGDRMSQLLAVLRTKDLSWSVFALLLVLAFWFGALHALEPGHGKTMAAAYLVGSRGTPKHALILGATVTFTHTISVFALGLGTMFLSQYIMPDKITKWLGVLSGLSIVWIGGLLLWKRSQALSAAGQSAVSDAEQEAAHAHAHALGLAHTHGGRTHSHVPEGEISMSSLMALGASGGLVPCPSALILLLSAISIGRPGLGVILLLAFSLGLAIVLTVTGMAVLYAKNLLPENNRKDNFVFRYMPVVSAAAIVFVGIVMTGVSMGWFPSIRFFG